MITRILCRPFGLALITLLIGQHTSNGLVNVVTAFKPSIACISASSVMTKKKRNDGGSNHLDLKRKKSPMFTATHAIPRGGSSSGETILKLSPEALAFAESIAPKIGIFTSSALYFAPTLAVWNAIQQDDIGDLNPLPLGIMSIVSVAWLAYGITSRDIYVTLSNIGGSIVSIGYVVGILPLLGKSTTKKGGSNSNEKSQLRMTQFVVMLGTSMTLGMWTILGLQKDTNLKKISSVLGTFASCLFILLCSSPLTTIKKVITTKNSSSILGSLTMTQITNTLLWSIYGLAIQDLFVYGPNIVVRTVINIIISSLPQ